MAKLPPVDIVKLKELHRAAIKKGIPYGYGSKAPTLSAPLRLINDIDCSGYVRWLLYQNGGLVIPDGSQIQREFFEDNGYHKLAKYEDVVYANPNRLFIAFIKPWTKGCKAVGHVWLVTQFEAGSDVKTLESYGGHGVGSRIWNSTTLKNQAYSAFEIPVK